MMTLSDLRRILRPLMNKIYLTIGRGVLKALSNAEGTQKVQLLLLADEVRSGMERFQEYGLETYPFTEAEALAVFQNGNRQQGVVICAHDRRYRPKDLAQGEICLYTDEGKMIHLKRGSIVEIPDTISQMTIGGVVDIDIDSSKVTISGVNNIDLGSTVKALVNDELVNLYNNHVHTGVTTGGGSSGPPAAPMVAGTHTTTKVKAE